MKVKNHGYHFKNRANRFSGDLVSVYFLEAFKHRDALASMYKELTEMHGASGGDFLPDSDDF